MPRVELTSIDKSFGDTQVLFDVSLVVEDGSFVVLLGPSGCGKSTTLRLIAGLEAAGSGSIRIGDRIVDDVPASERELAMVFQNYALFPHLSVAENVLYGLKVRRVPKQERARRLDEAAGLVGLEGYLDRKPSQLSGGQRQRVALARALVSGCSLILMDEPLSNLDAKLRQQMRLELRDLQRELGLTVVYVTHDQVEAMTMADQVAVMRDGRIDQYADPRTLYRWPSRAEVARFIGAPPMNLLPGTPVDGGVIIDGTGVLVPLTEGVPLPDRLLVGVRPEDLETAGSGSGLALDGRVETVELLGADLLVRVDVGAEHPLIARLPGAAEVASGSALPVRVPAPAVRLFDADSGERVTVAAIPEPETSANGRTGEATSAVHLEDRPDASNP